MKTSGKVWILFDSTNKTQSKPMSVIQAQVALLAVDTKLYSRFFIWTPGWKEWISLKEFFDSEQNFFVFEKPPAPVKGDMPPPTEEITETRNAPASKGDNRFTEVVSGSSTPDKNSAQYHQKDFNGDDLDLIKIRRSKKSAANALVKNDDEPASDDRRRATRHNFKIEVVLVSKSRSFRTYSSNISLSGTLLEEPMPREFFNEFFDLILVNPFERDPAKARLLFRAKIVGDHSNPRRLMFIEQDVDMTVRLDALLKAYVQYQKMTSAS